MARRDKSLRIPNHAYTRITRKSRRGASLRAETAASRILTSRSYIARLNVRAHYFAHPGLKAVSTLAFAEIAQKYGALFEPQEKYCCSADWSELRKVL